MELETEQLVLRPMNCPHRPYPYLRIDSAELPRASGEAGGARHDVSLRAVGGPQWIEPRPLHDAQRCPYLLHARPDKREFSNVMRLVEQSYGDLGIKDYSYRLSLRDPSDKEKYVQNDEMWELGERVLREAMDGWASRTGSGLAMRRSTDQKSTFSSRM